MEWVKTYRIVWSWSPGPVVTELEERLNFGATTYADRDAIITKVTSVLGSGFSFMFEDVLSCGPDVRFILRVNPSGESPVGASMINFESTREAIYGPKPSPPRCLRPIMR